MRIVWSVQDSQFQAEIPPGEQWRDDMELVRSIGFKTSGPPTWTWHTTKISSLDKLRSSNPKSGLTITELALEKYNSLKQQLEKKLELKKLFATAVKDAEDRAPSKWPTYTDPDTGIICFVVSPAETEFTWKYIPPAHPEQYCFVCGSWLYFLDYPDVCMWCSEHF